MTSPNPNQGESPAGCSWRIEEDGVAVVELPTNTRAAVSDSLRGTFEELFQKDPKALVLWLAGTRMIDSSGLSVLVSVHRTARQREIPLVLAEPQPQVLSLLELTRMQQLLPILEDLEHALTEVRGSI